MLSVEGAADSDVGAFENIAKIVKKSKVYEMDSNFANPALSTLKILSGGHHTTRVTDNLRSDALKLCASSDKSVTVACGPKFAKLHWHSQERTFASQQLPLDLSPERLYNASGFWSKLRHIGTLDTQSAKFVPNSDTQLAELDLNHEVINMFFSELSLFAALPRMLTAEKLLQDDVPDFVYLSLAGLQKIKKHYGNKSPEFVSATRVLNIAVPAILSEWRTVLGGKLQEIVYLKKTGTRAVELGAHETAVRRKLLATNGTNPFKTSGPKPVTTGVIYTLSDIGEYQIVLWMTFLGVIVVFAASVALGNMSFLEDDAGLYSSFKATEDYGEMRHGHVHDD